MWFILTDKGKTVDDVLNSSDYMEVITNSIILDFGTGAAPPPDEIIDFILDRPSIFAITTKSIPMFVGPVNDP